MLLHHHHQEGRRGGPTMSCLPVSAVSVGRAEGGAGGGGLGGSEGGRYQANNSTLTATAITSTTTTLNTTAITKATATTPFSTTSSSTTSTSSTASSSSSTSSSSPNMDSTLSLVKQLVSHFVDTSFDRCRVRNREREEVFKGRLKVLVFSILLSHQKDPVCEASSLRLSELEEVIWHTHVLRQQRRYDDANTLDACLQSLRQQGHLAEGSDVRRVMRLLVALKGQGGAEGEVQQPVLAQLRPRIVHQEENTPSFLPLGPLQYGDTFLQKAESGRPFLSFPSTLYSRLPSSLPQGRPGTLFDLDEMMRLSAAPPGTGVSSLLTGKNDALEMGKVLGALLQESRKEVNPNLALTLPKLPHRAKGYSPFTLSTLPATTTTITTIPPKDVSPSGNSGSGGDEGYASSHSTGSHSPEDEEEDPWENVLATLPLPTHRSWATLGHIPEAKEKPFISEAGAETTHNVWLLYQELWSIVGGRSIPRLFVRSVRELCQDVLYLLVGVPSLSFLWSDEDECFSIKEGLCHPTITPEALKGSLLPLVECGTLVHRLEMLCATPRFSEQEVLRQGSVVIAFTFAISNVLKTYREKVLGLGEETLFSALQDKAEPLVKKIKFIASLCKITAVSKRIKETRTIIKDIPSLANTRETADTSQGSSGSRQQQEEAPTELPRGLALLGELLNTITTTKDRDCLLLLISIFKSSCEPFFRYLEDWIYRGVRSDPSTEFMVEVNGAALLRRDRTYWTSGYTLRPHASIPPILRSVLEEAFLCGKTLNLLRLCSTKHYLTCGMNNQPAMEMCASGAELIRMQSSCELYAAHIDHLAAQLQVTVQQKVVEERQQKQRLATTSVNKYAATLREIEGKMVERNQRWKEEKEAKFKELKEAMMQAEQRKQEQKDKEAEEDLNIALEHEEMARKQIDQENALRTQMEEFYQQKMKAAERAEALARWKMQRRCLSAARAHCIESTKWDPLVETESAPIEAMEEENVSSFPQTPDSIPEEPKVPDQGQEEKEEVPICGALKRPHQMNTQGRHRAEGYNFEPYLLQTERNENLLKESPNQEVSSVSDMTASLMSTSSDFVDTPFDENLPEFEPDPKIQTIPETCYVKSSTYEYAKTSIEAVLNDNMNGNLNKNNFPCQDVGATSPNDLPPIMLTESPDANANVPESIAILEAHSQQGNTAEHIIGTIIENQDYEDSGMRNRTNTVIENKNYKSIQTEKMSDVSEKRMSQTKDHQGYSTADQEDHQGNTNTTNTTTTTATTIDDNTNDNFNELVLQFKERRAQAAAIKEKVLNEYHQATIINNNNNMNILKSRSISSSSAVAKNRQHVLETEYGMAEDTEAQEEVFGGSRTYYSRQVSSTSTASFRTCSSLSSERPMSTSTAFTSPDEERPVLIDQVRIAFPLGYLLRLSQFLIS